MIIIMTGVYEVTRKQVPPVVKIKLIKRTKRFW